MLVLQNALYMSVFSFDGICEPSSFQLTKELTLTARSFMTSLERLTVFSQLPLFVIGGLTSEPRDISKIW